MAHRESGADKLTRMTEIERDYWSAGMFPAGMDEAGRGPLAGPVVAACVVLPHDDLIVGINDSKKISARKRELFYALVLEKAVSSGVGIVDAQDVDTINVLQATKKACVLAYNQMLAKPKVILVDALDEMDIPSKLVSIVHGDARSYLIAAASIIAKVTRDNIMLEYDKIYPQYGFAKHKGYGTKDHFAAIRVHGICPIHRTTYLKSL